MWAAFALPGRFPPVLTDGLASASRRLALLFSNVSGPDSGEQPLTAWTGGPGSRRVEPLFRQGDGAGVAARPGGGPAELRARTFCCEVAAATLPGCAGACAARLRPARPSRPGSLVSEFQLYSLLSGSDIFISVYSPGFDSGVIVPPCSRMMSWDRLRPSPVPRLASLVVKKGLNIFSITSGVIPVPLSRIVTRTASSVRRVFSRRTGWYAPFSRLALSAIAPQALLTRLMNTRARFSATTFISPAEGVCLGGISLFPGGHRGRERHWCPSS